MLKKKKGQSKFYLLLVLLLLGAALLSLFYNQVLLKGERISPQTVMLDPETVQNKGRINLNTATAEELCQLHGLGEKLAERIVAYREEHGGFRSVQELMEVKGIGEKLYRQISDEITV